MEYIPGIEKALVVSEINEKTQRIITPFKLPDGDLVEVYLIKDSSGFVLTDLGETAMYLNMENKDPGILRSEKVKTAFSCLGIEIVGNELRLPLEKEPTASQILTAGASFSFPIALSFPEKRLFRFKPVFRKTMSFKGYTFSRLSRATSREITIRLAEGEMEELHKAMERHDSDIFQIEGIPELSFTTAGDREAVIFFPERL